MIASEKVPRVRSRAPRRPRGSRPAPARAAAAVPITPVEATATCSGSTPSASAVAACCASAGLEPAPAVADVRVRRVGRHRAQRAGARLARHHHGRAHARVGGEAGGRHRVLRVAHEHAHVEALRLEPGRHAGGPETRARGRWARARVTCAGTLDPARAEEAVRRAASRPSRVSGRPEHQVQVLHAPARPRPSRGCRWPRTRSSGRPPRVTCTRQRLVSCTCRVCGGSSTTSTNGSPA